MSEETRKLLKEIKECDSLHNNCDYLLEHSDCDLLIEYIEQLQNNWNELKKWLEEIQQEEFDINGFTGVCTEIRINCILDKMQELEGNDE